MTERIEHCPQCGGKAAIADAPEYVRVRCYVCGTEGRGVFFGADEDDAEQEAVAHWNAMCRLIRPNVH